MPRVRLPTIAAEHYASEPRNWPQTRQARFSNCSFLRSVDLSQSRVSLQFAQLTRMFAVPTSACLLATPVAPMFSTHAASQLRWSEAPAERVIEGIGSAGASPHRRHSWITQAGRIRLGIRRILT